jgi:hypothetical protein
VEACTAAESLFQRACSERIQTLELEFLAHSMNRECAAKLLAAPVSALLPSITRILDIAIPVRMADGGIVIPRSGYDARFKSYLDPSAPPIRPMPYARALELLHEVLRDFCWKDKQSFTHGMARLITPLCRGLMGWDARFPLWQFSANRPRCWERLFGGHSAAHLRGAHV